jgi:RHS repeat-associated protein
MTLERPRKKVFSLCGLTLDPATVMEPPAVLTPPRVEHEALRGGAERQLHFAGDRLMAVRELAAEGSAMTRYRHDANGRLVETEDAQGTRTIYHYDDRSRLAEACYPGGSRAAWRYDPQGRLAEYRNRAGSTRRYLYNQQGHLAGVTDGEGQVASYTYDAGGRLAEIVDPVCTTRYTYDNGGRTIRVERIIAGVDHVTEMAYDGGRLVGLRPPGSSAWMRYCYDATGRLCRVETDGGRVGATFEGSDLTGVKLCFENGVVAEYRTGPTGLEAITVRPGDGVPPTVDLHYAYDAAGNIVQVGSETYQYDAFNRLTVVGTADGQVTEYVYSLTGDRLVEACAGQRRTSVYDAAGWLCHTTDLAGHVTRYAYDIAGRCTRCEDPRGTIVYHYNAGNCLDRVTRNDLTVAEYGYDAAGQLTWRRDCDGMTVYHYDPLGRLLAETDGAGRARVTYIRVNWTDIARVAGPLERGAAFYTHVDHLGSLRALTDEAGQPVWVGSYAPFGTPRAEMPPGGHQFMGHWHDAATGLYNFGARWYDPEMGRFLTPDPYTCGPDDLRLWQWDQQSPMNAARQLERWLRRPQRRNGYVLCHNNPMCAIDPDGHWSVGWILLNIVVGTIWTLPWTILGLAVGVLNTVLQIFRPLLGVVANVGGWQGLGFDAAACPRLNTYGIFLGGGLLGTIIDALGILAITMGNSVWIIQPQLGNRPTYDHELRHTNQYEWLGPFFHLGLPIWGVYWWDVIVNGYFNSALETDARREAAKGCS